MKAIYYIRIAMESAFEDEVRYAFAGVVEPGCTSEFTLRLTRAGVPYSGMNPSADTARLIAFNSAMDEYHGEFSVSPLWATVLVGTDECIASSDQALVGQRVTWDDFLSHFNLEEVTDNG